MNSTHATYFSIAAGGIAMVAMLTSLGRNDAALPPEPDPRVEVLLRQQADVTGAIADLRRDHDELAARLRATESQRSAMLAPASVTPDARADAVPGEVPPPPPAPAPPRTESSDRDELLANLARVFRSGTRDPGLDDAKQEEFWRRLRTTPIVDELIADLESRVERNPGDTTARLQLADVYSAKLSTIPGGPEQGVWGGKAERQWRTIIEQQPDNWEAQFALGFNYSMYPSFVDRSAEAIEHLEVARRQLATMPPEPRQADVYVGLARMYQRQGKPDLARAAIAEGLQRFPSEDSLARTRQQLGASEDR